MCRSRFVPWQYVKYHTRGLNVSGSMCSRTISYERTSFCGDGHVMATRNSLDMVWYLRGISIFFLRGPHLIISEDGSFCSAIIKFGRSKNVLLPTTPFFFRRPNLVFGSIEHLQEYPTISPLSLLQNHPEVLAPSTEPMGSFKRIVG